MREKIIQVQRCYHFCCKHWYMRWPGLFLFMSLVDIAEFPLVHSIWNLVGFEGFFK